MSRPGRHGLLGGLAAVVVWMACASERPRRVGADDAFALVEQAIVHVEDRAAGRQGCTVDGSVVSSEWRPGTALRDALPLEAVRRITIYDDSFVDEHEIAHILVRGRVVSYDELPVAHRLAGHGVTVQRADGACFEVELHGDLASGGRIGHQWFEVPER